MKNLQRRVTVLAAALSLTAAPSARAYEAIDTIPWPSRGLYPAYPADETRPTGIMLEAGVLRDDNVLRSETTPQSDTITRVGGAVRHEQRIFGRQRLRLDARYAWGLSSLNTDTSANTHTKSRGFTFLAGLRLW